MIIQDGFASKPFEIRVSSNYEKTVAEFWTEMFDDMKHSELEIPNDDLNSDKFRTEVLHYATLTELIELRNELNTVIKDLAGV